MPKVSFGAPVGRPRASVPDTVIDVKLGCIDPENRVAEFAAAGADAIVPSRGDKQPAAAPHPRRRRGPGSCSIQAPPSRR